MGRCGWEEVQAQFFRGWFFRVPFGHSSCLPRHFSSGDYPLFIHHTISNGNILAGVIALPIHYQLSSLLKKNNFLGRVVVDQILEAHECFRAVVELVIQSPLRSLFDGPRLLV